MSESKKEELLVIDEKKEIKERFELSRILRFALVSSFILLNITFGADVGVIASSKFKLQSALNFNDKEFAAFNSITSIGRILGIFIYMGLLTRDNKKLLTSICLLARYGLFFSFLFTSQKFLLYLETFSKYMFQYMLINLVSNLLKQ